MKRLLAVGLLLGCGGVTKTDLTACRDEGRNVAKAEGCAFVSSGCMASEDPAWDVECELQLECAGQVIARPHFCRMAR